LLSRWILFRNLSPVFADLTARPPAREIRAEKEDGVVAVSKASNCLQRQEKLKTII